MISRFYLTTLISSALAAAPITITVGVPTDISQSMTNGGLYTAGNPLATDLRGALNQTNLSPNSDGYIINFSTGFTNPISLGAMLPILNLVQPYPLTIDGGNNAPIVIDGGNAYRGFFVHSGTVCNKKYADSKRSSQGWEWRQRGRWRRDGSRRSPFRTRRSYSISFRSCDQGCYKPRRLRWP